MTHQFYFSPHILDNLSIPKTGFDVVQDIAEPRLRMYITARGIKTFFVRKRVNGRDTRIIIGKYPGMNIDTARARIPNVVAAASVPRKVRRKKITFGDFTNFFVATKIKRTPASTAKLKRAINRMWAPLFDISIDKISAADILKVHESIADVSGVPTANRMREIMSGIFRTAVDMGYRTKNPVADVPKFKEVRKSRTLTSSMLRRIHHAIKTEKNPLFRDAFLMLLYGFESKSKIFSMRWRDINLNSETWGVRPLSDKAVDLLREMPETSKWVFPHWGHHLTDPRSAWQKTMERAKTPNVTMADVYKFISRRLEWTADRYELRENMNTVLTELL